MQVWIRSKAASIAAQARSKQVQREVARAEAIEQRKQAQQQQQQQAAAAAGSPGEGDPRCEDMVRVLRDHLVLYNKEPPLVECLQCLRKILDNVLAAPADSKFRKLKASKKLLADRVLALRGGAAFLKAVGFDTAIIDFEEYYVCDDPDEADLDRLRLATELLDREIDAAAERTAAKAAKEVERQRRIMLGSTLPSASGL